MKEGVVLLMLIFLLDNFTYCQLYERPVNAYSVNGACSNTQSDVFAVIHNPASLSRLKRGAVGMMSERPYLINQLQFISATTAILSRSGNMMMHMSQAVYSQWKEMLVSLGYARKLGANIDIGLRIHYHSVRLPEDYGNAASPGFEFGTLIRITDNIHAGFYTVNPVGGKFGTGKQEKFPSRFYFGVGYEASEKFLLCVEIEKEENKPASVNAAVTYRPVQKILLKTGILSVTASPFFGVGIDLKKFRIDIAAQYHSAMGLTPALYMQVPFLKNGMNKNGEE